MPGLFCSEHYFVVIDKYDMRKSVTKFVFFALISLVYPVNHLAQTTTKIEPKPPGKLIDIGGYRLHINCTGKGGPTVILIAGAGDFSFDWSLVQPGISKFGRVCSYDRAGLAWSDPGPTPRTMRQEAHELRTLLKKAGIEPPYVLVGHSIGGLISRVYADSFPAEVTGLVLVDSTTENTKLSYQGKIVRVRDSAKDRPIPDVQTMATSPPKPPTQDDLKQVEFNNKIFGAPRIETPFNKLPQDIQTLRLWALNNPKLSAATDDFWAEELQSMYVGRSKNPFPLGDKPLVVVIGSKSGQIPPDVSPDEWERLSEERRREKVGLAKLSRNGSVVFAEQSGHHIQLDEPEVVVDAIRRVVDAIRTK